jgi:hypothetical protein
MVETFKIGDQLSSNLHLVCYQFELILILKKQSVEHGKLRWIGSELDNWTDKLSIT